MTIRVARQGRVTLVTIDRPEARNAVDTEHARALYDAFLEFDADPGAHVAVLAGADGTFCAGADLRAVAAGSMRAEPPSVQAVQGLDFSDEELTAIDEHAVEGGINLWEEPSTA